MFESPYEVAFVATTVILGLIGWGIFVLIVNKMLRRADIRHTEARAQLDAKSNTARIVTEKKSWGELLVSDWGHKHEYRLKRVTATHYGFMCEGYIWDCGLKLRCSEWRDIPKNDFWGDPMSTKRLFAKAVRERMMDCNHEASTVDVKYFYVNNALWCRELHGCPECGWYETKEYVICP